MGTAVLRSGHRRQSSGDNLLPALGAPTVTLDGRLLEAPEGQQRGRQQKEEESRGATKPQAKAAVVRPAYLGRPSERSLPMTPPRVSGVSLAPLPNADHAYNPGGGERPAPAPANPKLHHQLQRRPSVTVIAIGGKAPPPPAAVIMPPCNGPAPGGTGAGGGNQQLIAEGRGIQRGTSMGDWMAAYLDINGLECDSICATPPPRLNMQALARGDTGGVFGPLSPCPLSPSILTVCAQPGLDDQFAPVGAGGLIDMRTCQSPRLPPV